MIFIAIQVCVKVPFEYGILDGLLLLLNQILEQVCASLLTLACANFIRLSAKILMTSGHNKAKLG